MNIPQVVRVLDILATSFVFGATVWFFFVQSPLLLKRMGREKFVPLQMQLTRVLFKALSVALLALFGMTFAHSKPLSGAAIAAAIALAGGLMNRFVIVPRALRAGGRSRRDIKGKDEEGSTEKFVSEGAGSKTKTLHRLVVLFVVVMLAGAVGHVIALLGAAAP